MDIKIWIWWGGELRRIQIRRRRIPKKIGKMSGEIRRSPGKNKNGELSHPHFHFYRDG